MKRDPSLSGENPFCTRRIRPGALKFLYSQGSNAEAILEKLRKNDFRGAIVGPHGSGKSTLLAELTPRLEAEGWRIERIDLHDGQRRLPIDLRRLPECERRMIVVDGYEQLSFWSRFLLTRRCRRKRWGLIATAHRSVGLPMLYETEVSLELAVRVVESVLQESGTAISHEEIAERYKHSGENLREMLFGLYDLVEEGKSK
jgi:energy-coupling factor transporter ATP-binding protein EcfA2